MNGNKHFTRSVVFLCTILGVTAGGMILDYFLLQNGVRPFHVLLLSNVLMAVSAATLWLVNGLRQQTKLQTLADRLETVWEMNRHVRSALTAIAFYGKQTDDDRGMEVVSESLARIEDSLRGVASRWNLIGERQVEVRVPWACTLRNILKFSSS